MNTLIISGVVITAAFAAPVVAGEGGTGTWGGLIFYVVLAIGLSFLCSVLEAVLLSTNMSFVELQVDNGHRSAKIMQDLKADVERPISAILTLNTFAHTIGAAGAGAEAVGIFGSEWFGLISAILTILILVFSEIIPKTIGATYWKQLNGLAAYVTLGLVWLLFPAVWLLEKTTQGLKGHGDSPTVSRLELAAMARISTIEGTLQEGENRILTNLLHLRNVQVREVMTPRTVVLAFQEDMTLTEVLTKHRSLPYSRIPIYNENHDDITGFVLRHDLYYRYATEGDDVALRDLKREIHGVPETNSVAQVLDSFMVNQEHIYLVIDEYGGTAGIITMEDALESLLGIEITDESDLVADLRKMAEQRYARQSKLLEVTTGSPQSTGTPETEPSDTPETSN